MVTTLAVLVIFVGCMLAAAWSDIVLMKIPNWISLALIVGFFVITPFVWAGWSIFGTHLLVMIVVFAVVAVMFELGWMGGGDAKLLSATSLWWVWQDLPYYLIFTALAGGVLTLGIILLRTFFPAQILKSKSLYRLLKDEKRIPYGLALAIGALITLPNSQIYLKAAGLS